MKTTAGGALRIKKKKSFTKKSKQNLQEENKSCAQEN